MQKHGPWLIKSSKKIYANKYGLKVREDQVVRPDGLDGIHGVVNVREGVQVLCVDEKGFAYLTKDFHYAVGRVGIEVVAGGINAGEIPIDAAKRELLEELGITAKKWVSLGELDPLTTSVAATQYAFLALDLKFGKPNLEGSESVLTLVKMPFSELERKCLDGEINHALTIATVFRAREKLNNVF